MVNPSSPVVSIERKPYPLPAVCSCILLHHGVCCDVPILLRQWQRDAGHDLDVGLHIHGRTGGGEAGLGSLPDLLQLINVSRLAAHVSGSHGMKKHTNQKELGEGDVQRE